MYNESQFKNLQFNPLQENKMIVEYPQLKEIIDNAPVVDEYKNAWLKDADTDKKIRFAILCFDPKSRLVFDERDINYRKQIAADLAKIKSEDLLQDIYSFKDKCALEIVLGYLTRFVKSREWSAIVALEYKFEENIRELMTPIKGDSNKERLDAAQKKSIISGEIDVDIKRLEALYNQFFGHDVELEQAFKIKRYSPEIIARNRN